MPIRTKGEDPAFITFWVNYPRRDDKGHARSAWVRALKKADAETIIAGLREYRFNPDPRFIPMPATWLNGERWDIDPSDGIDPVLRAAGLTAGDLQ